MIYEIAGRTETGPVRECNEDHLQIGSWIKNRGWMGLTLADDDEQIIGSGLLLAVADGMGGYAGGKTASRLALESLATALSRTTPPAGLADILSEDLAAAMHQANGAVRKAQEQDVRLTQMGSTLSAMLLTASGYWVLHAGDSRVLRIRNRFVRPLTRDDNLGERLIAQGIDAESAAAHPEAASLTNWLGSESMQPKVVAGDPHDAGDHLVICSDGLYGFIEEEALVSALDDHQRPLWHTVDALIESAITAGSTDNLSLILIRIADVTRPIQENAHEPQ